MLNLNGNGISPEAGTFIRNYGTADSVAVKEESSVRDTQNTNGTHEINLSDLNVGDVFGGEILNINSHEVSILLNDNNVINAMLKQSFELNIGQNVVFQVKEKSDDRIFIKPLSVETVSSELIQKSLNSAGLTVNNKNSLIVSSLIEHGQPIDRQTVISFIKLSNQFGIENMDKLINMTKQGLPITGENLEMYDKYVNSTHQISEIISNLPDGITEYLENLINSDTLNPLPELNHFLDMLNEISEVFEAENLEGTEKTGTEGRQTETISNIGAETKNVADETVSVKKESVVLESADEGEMPAKGAKNSETIKTAEDVNHSDSFKHTETVRELEVLKDSGTAKTSETMKNSEGVKTSMDEKMFTGEGFTENNIKDSNSTDTLKDVAKDIQTMIEHGNQIGQDGRRTDLLKIKERIRNIFKDNLMLNIESDDKTDEIKQQVDKVYEKLVKTADIIKNNVTAQKDNSLSSSANDLKNNLNFMNELNRLESYVQLPVKFSAEDANGDLYVYNRRKNKKNGDDPLTAFLHLDLTYLGATDVNVSLKNKGVKIVFTLDNEVSEKLVQEHLDELVNRLEKKGYHAVIDANSVKKETETVNNALLPITEHNDNVISIKRYTLDIRT